MFYKQRNKKKKKKFETSLKYFKTFGYTHTQEYLKNNLPNKTNLR